MTINLAQALVDFNEDFVLGEVRKRVDKGEDPIRIIRELQDGMDLIGNRFNTGEFFLSELMMSADLFTRAMQILEPELEGKPISYIGEMVIGTPKGDIHDIGKNIFCTVAKAAGFKIHDLGVDVPVERFIEAVEEIKPQVLGFSALITPSFNTMKQVVWELEQRGLRGGVKVIVGGGVVTETVMKYIGADGYTTDAIHGLNQCKKFVTI